MVESYTSPETTFSNGGTIELIVPSGITILSASVRFCGISSTRTGWAEDTYSSDISEVVNGGVSPGGTFGASVTAASCRYIGRSSYSQGGGTPGNTGWTTGSWTSYGTSVHPVVTVPNLPSGKTFTSATLEFTAQWDQTDSHTSSLVTLNGSGWTVLYDGQSVADSMALSQSDCGQSRGVYLGCTWGQVRGYCRAIVYYTSSTVTETKTGTCSGSYGAYAAGPINNNQSVYDNLSAPPVGDFYHSIGGSGQAGFQYFFTYQYQYQYEIKTTNPVATVNGQSASYGAAINNGTWTSWIAFTSGAALTPGASNIISLGVAGSGTGKVQITYTYDRARPTLLDEVRVKKPLSIQSTPVVSITDPELDLPTYCRICGNGPAIRCWDLVESYDGDASFVRVRMPGGTKSVRKKI